MCEKECFGTGLSRVKILASIETVSTGNENLIDLKSTASKSISPAAYGSRTVSRASVRVPARLVITSPKTLETGELVKGSFGSV
jgi:hypothetical protein